MRTEPIRMGARVRNRRSRRWWLHHRQCRRQHRSERTRTTARSDPGGNGDANIEASASTQTLDVITAPPIVGPDWPLAPVGAAPDLPRVGFRLVPKHWADILRMLTAGEYVDGERLVTALNRPPL
jgi:hypothetical protein